MDITVSVDSDDAAELNALFDGHGSNPGTEEFIEFAAQASVAVVSRSLALRQLSAITGAMRWPWSQEFAIRIRPPEAM
jgi:hypothetical protein